ncbi:uncharacterized protein LOC123311550 [Coccinella septempunctata]|uniref:uncharacterized protein LOC123311550 n=1 Tax=Coccinella septempunctata TaxID=41139 RepID=UPI001D060DBA|nr:uncharacterized protein LOC123311550 [Coccinella septempunctata]
MGSSESKLKSIDGKAGKVKTPTNSPPSTPIKCINSNSEDVSRLDPRSPSDDIFRTPIEIPIQTNDKAMSHLKHVVDPRSPTDQFERTPIIIKDNQSKCPKKLHNKILDNARRNISYSPTLSSKNKKDCDSAPVSPPKLISSVPTFKKCNEKRKSFVGLLETNIDFTETNLDDFVKNKSLDKSLTISINEIPMCDIVEHKNCDPRSPSKDILRTPIQIVQKIGEVDFNNTTDQCQLKEVADTVECDNSESLLKLAGENNQLQNTEEVEVHPHNIEAIDVAIEENVAPQLSDANPKDANISENVNEMPQLEIESLTTNAANTEQIMADIVEDLIGNISVLTTEDTKTVPHIDNNDSKEPIIDLTADVQEFDKKLTKIIHENNENFSFKKIISKEYLNDKNQSKKRTPMKDRNQISEPKRNKLKVSDKPTKLNYDISKIPVFRDKKGLKTKVQCENTPPTDSTIRRRKKSHQPKWDSDKTLVI